MWGDELFIWSTHNVGSWYEGIQASHPITPEYQHPLSTSDTDGELPAANRLYVNHYHASPPH